MAGAAFIADGRMDEEKISVDIDKLKSHVVDEVPRYSYLGKDSKDSKYKCWKFRIANWLMEGKLMGTVHWYCNLLDILEMKK